jgi:hypothetical protein
MFVSIYRVPASVCLERPPPIEKKEAATPPGVHARCGVVVVIVVVVAFVVKIVVEICLYLLRDPYCDQERLVEGGCEGSSFRDSARRERKVGNSFYPFFDLQRRSQDW